MPALCTQAPLTVRRINLIRAQPQRGRYICRERLRDPPKSAAPSRTACCEQEFKSSLGGRSHLPRAGLLVPSGKGCVGVSGFKRSRLNCDSGDPCAPADQSKPRILIRVGAWARIRLRPTIKTGPIIGSWLCAGFRGVNPLPPGGTKGLT